MIPSDQMDDENEFPYLVLAVPDLATNYLADQQIARVPILKYLDNNLERTVHNAYQRQVLVCRPTNTCKYFATSSGAKAPLFSACFVRAETLTHNPELRPISGTAH